MADTKQHFYNIKQSGISAVPVALGNYLSGLRIDTDYAVFADRKRVIECAIGISNEEICTGYLISPHRFDVLGI